MTTTLQTSLPLPVLIIGALLSIVFFVFLFRGESAGLRPWMRWILPALRTVLCVLVWALIAQPRAVTSHEEEIPVTTRLGVDVSGSMAIVDEYGAHTTGWQDDAEPTPMDEAIALVEAAKIRINLLARQGETHGAGSDDAIEGIREILSRAGEKVGLVESSTDLARLLRPPQEAVSRALEHLDDIDGGRDAVQDLERAAGFTTEAARGLRRVAAIAPEEFPVPGAPRPRVELVNRWMEGATSLFERLADIGEVELFSFATTMARGAMGERLASGDALGGERTDLYGNLNRLADEDRSEGRQLRMLITDGRDSYPAGERTISPRVAEHPLLVLPVGDPSTAPDVFVGSVISPARVREEDALVARVEVAGIHAGSEDVTVSLLDGGEVLDSREVRLGRDGEPVTVELSWTAAGPGPHDLRVEVSTVSGEKILGNNHRLIPCQVMKDRYNVLVCDSQPRWDTRYLQNLFKRDASIEMTSLVFQPRHAYPGQPLPPLPALPLALELWQKFDLVILGDVNPRQLTPDHQALLVEYVDSGGNLVILAGFDAMPAAFSGGPLEKLIPMTQVQSDPVRGVFVIGPPADRAVDPMVRLDGLGGQPVWRSLFGITPQHRMSPWCKAKESARLLLTATDQRSGAVHDFMALQRFGRGRVAFAAAPCMYHLRTNHGDRYHARFWGQMIRGICVDNFGFEGGLVKTRLDRALWDPGAEVQGRVRLTVPGGLPLRDAVFSAVLRQGEAVVARMQPVPDPDRPGDYFIRFPDAEPGEYVIEFEGDEVDPLVEDDRQAGRLDPNRRFTVLSDAFSVESIPASEDSPFWNRVNQLPLAATVSPAALPLLLDALDLKPEHVTHISARSLWDVWWLLLAIVAVSGTEWLLRRTNGLS